MSQAEDLDVCPQYFCPILLETVLSLDAQVILVAQECFSVACHLPPLIIWIVATSCLNFCNVLYMGSCVQMFQKLQLMQHEPAQEGVQHIRVEVGIL